MHIAFLIMLHFILLCGLRGNEVQINKVKIIHDGSWKGRINYSVETQTTLSLRLAVTNDSVAGYYTISRKWETTYKYNGIVTGHRINDTIELQLTELQSDSLRKLFKYRSPNSYTITGFYKYDDRYPNNNRYVILSGYISSTTDHLGDGTFMLERDTTDAKAYEEKK